MKKRIPRDPELEAVWAELETWTRKRVAGFFERMAAEAAREERRRARLRPLTVGSLGR